MHLLLITHFTIKNAGYVTIASSMQEATSEITKVNLEDYLTNLKLQLTRSDERTLLIQKQLIVFFMPRMPEGDNFGY